jgi:hypothetical protein
VVDFGVMSATVTFNFISNENKEEAKKNYGQSGRDPFGFNINKFDQLSLFHLGFVTSFVADFCF